VLLVITSLGGNNATKNMLFSQQQASDRWTLSIGTGKMLNGYLLIFALPFFH
jgi:hypothetical protein